MTTFTTTINAMYTLDTPDPGFVVNVLWTVTGVEDRKSTRLNSSHT